MHHLDDTLFWLLESVITHVNEDKPRDSMYGLYAENVGQSATSLTQGTRDVTQAQSSYLCDPVVAARWRCYIAPTGKIL